ncbi:glycosyltransferase family 39 protein [Hyalangium versicolor]|uniref:glycosyltransferase family 39 protein n=1 Tax=Hyalangium versicolor TaxID=2861190 RepID=UPI001CCCCAB2|nr:glycosyltransferase family 39 protein [Hyalangium versicolor]
MAPAETTPSLTAPLPPRFRVLALVVICAMPLGFSLPSLFDPFGQTEEAVNATIWGLGARNLLAQGPLDSQLGARVSPFPGPGPRPGIYAHHPPLPVWVSALVQLFTLSEAGPRLAALGAAGLALLLLFRVLRLLVSEPLALLATAVIASSPYVLIYGRLLTTLTLATPLFLFALEAVLRRILRGEPWRWPLLAAFAGLVLSSWDGTIGAVVLSLSLAWAELRSGSWRRASAWGRALAPGLVTAVTLAAVGGWLVWANGGPEAMVWQFQYRSSSNLPGASAWLSKQLGFLGGGLGWGTLVVLASAAVWLPLGVRPRGLVPALLLSAAPGLGMLLIFRQGADRHPFWAYNLILPAAVAIAGILHALHARRSAVAAVAVALLGLQAVVSFRLAGDHSGRERILNARGVMLKDFFRTHPVPSSIRFVSTYNFYPFASWYLDRPIDVVPGVDGLRERLRTGAWPENEPVVVDTAQAFEAGCRPFAALAESPERRWAIAPAGVVGTACAR